LESQSHDPAEFRICLEQLAWPQRDLARVLGLDDRLNALTSRGKESAAGRAAVAQIKIAPHCQRRPVCPLHNVAIAVVRTATNARTSASKNAKVVRG